MRSAPGVGSLIAIRSHVVKATAARAGLSAEVSAHWLRHAPASPQPRPGCTHPSRPADTRPCLGGHHGPLPARPADRQLGPVSGGLQCERPAHTPRRANGEHGREIEPMTLANMRKHGAWSVAVWSLIRAVPSLPHAHCTRLSVACIRGHPACGRTGWHPRPKTPTRPQSPWCLSDPCRR